MTKPKGYVLWEGPSPIDGQPLVAIATLKTSNRKTGKMVQVWIIRSDISPLDAVSSGDDVSMCGDCPHRKQSDGKRSCYVNVGQAPQSVWRAYKRGAYVQAKSGAFKGLRVRWGAYGDPAVLPADLFHHYNTGTLSHTAYTHQWRQPWAHWAVGVMMASCDSVKDYDEAKAKGWRTFNVFSVVSKAAINAKQCPATVANSQAQCATCKLCNGSRADIYVHAHGPSRKVVTYA